MRYLSKQCKEHNFKLIFFNSGINNNNNNDDNCSSSDNRLEKVTITSNSNSSSGHSDFMDEEQNKLAQLHGCT